MAKVIQIDAAGKLFTAQAGLQFIDASKALREQGLQFMTNIEIGNMTLGAAACCHSKDALDGIEFGQVSSYVTRIKWVTPEGNLAEASEADSPDELRFVRSSYGLCGIIYEVTFRIKPIEALHFTYLPRPVDELTDAEVNNLLDTSEGLVCLDRREDLRVSAEAARRRSRHIRLFSFSRPPQALELWRCSRRALYRSVSTPQIFPRRRADRRLRRDQVSLRDASFIWRHNASCSGQNHRLPRHSAQRTVCVHILGISSRRVVNNPSRLS